MRFTVFVAGSVALQISAAVAQAPLPPERSPSIAAPPAASEKAAPEVQTYQTKLERLAALMGTLSYLRELCAPGDGHLWHDKMVDLLAAEGTTPDRRDRLAGAFNRGFDGYRFSHRQCTPAADLVIGRALAEGSRLAHELSARFGT